MPTPSAWAACDVELARRSQAGDPDAFDAIYRRYAGLVVATVRRLLRDRSDVDDVLQETFLIAFEQIAQLAEPAALRSWICRIAISRAHRKFRARRLAPYLSHADPDLLLDQQVSPEPSPADHAELARIDRVLSLALELRTPWILRHVVGAALDDIAAWCACSLATVKRRITLAEAAIARYVHAFEGARPLGPRRLARGTLAPVRLEPTGS